MVELTTSPSLPKANSPAKMVVPDGKASLAVSSVELTTASAVGLAAASTGGPEAALAGEAR